MSGHDDWDVLALAAPHIAALHAYQPGRQPEGEGWIKLNTNELPYPPSPRVAPAVAAACARLNKYPDPPARALRAAIARLHTVADDQVIVGNGSDDILNLLMRVFGEGAEVGQTTPSYSLYPVLAAMVRGTMCSVPLASDGALPLAAVAGLDTPIVFLTSPNAPTGVGFATADLATLATRCRGLLVIDEAYADFAADTAARLVRDHRNVVVTRTLSKSYGLAGLRVGYALASAPVIGLLDRVRDSYNVNLLSQAGALAAIEDQPYLRTCVERVVATRARFDAALRARGWHVYPSQANFVLARPQRGDGKTGLAIASDLFQHLEANRILVRHFPSNPLTAPYLRISIGSEDHMQQTLNAIDLWINRD
jgi:histidinol-phosphate aminotransferase